jgi:Zn-dependent protease with chaperone function
LFSNLFFLILLTFLLTFEPEFSTSFWIFSPLEAFGIGLGVYSLFILIIYLQTRLFRLIFSKGKSTFLFLVNSELLFFILIFYYMLLGQRIFSSHFQIFPILLGLGFYFCGLWAFHYFSYDLQRKLAQSPIHSAAQEAWTQLRMLVPFVIPFLLFVFISDLFSLIPNEQWDAYFSSPLLAVLIFAGISLLLMSVIMVILPLTLRWFWQCTPLENKELLARLETICQRAHFKHAGILNWTVMNNSLTAAIIGVAPRFRYVFFTKRLLNSASPEMLDAILAHEIGHSYRKHLFIFPFVIYGMFLTAILFFLFFGETFDQMFDLVQNPLREFVESIVLMVTFMVILALYFRFVFGFFSRTFERQADLHVFKVGVSPDAMIAALDYIGVALGNIHHLPSWHHFGIQERIDFLQKAKENPKVISNYHRKVKSIVWGFIILLAILTLVAIAPYFPQTALLKQIETFRIFLSGSIAKFFIIGNT